MPNKKNKDESTALDKIIDNTFNQLKNIVDANTVVGSTIKVSDKLFVLPVSKISVGLISGGGEDPKKNNSVVGAGSSTGFTITPIGFITINNNVIDYIGVTTTQNETSKLIDGLVGLSEKIINKVDNDNEKE